MLGLVLLTVSAIEGVSLQRMVAMATSTLISALCVLAVLLLYVISWLERIAYIKSAQKFEVIHINDPSEQKQPKA